MHWLTETMIGMGVSYRARILSHYYCVFLINL